MQAEEAWYGLDYLYSSEVDGLYAFYGSTEAFNPLPSPAAAPSLRSCLCSMLIQMCPPLPLPLPLSVHAWWLSFFHSSLLASSLCHPCSLSLPPSLLWNLYGPHTA
eukprot:2042156-Rhodomonas_salina.1